MKSVYCKNCVHRGWYNEIDGDSVLRCWRKKERNYDEIKISNLRCYIENKNCDCKYYKKKWYLLFK